jgi:cytochrome c
MRKSRPRKEVVLRRCIMKRITIVAAAIFFMVFALASAQDRGTASEAKAMIDKAVSFYKVNGQEKALATFNDPKGQFVNKDLYVFAVGLDGKVLANGANPALVGKGMNEIRDPYQKNFIEEMLVVAKSKGSGTVDYWWDNPQFQVVEEKTSYIEKVGAVIIGCGYYKDYRWAPQTR